MVTDKYDMPADMLRQLLIAGPWAGDRVRLKTKTRVREIIYLGAKVEWLDGKKPCFVQKLRVVPF